MSETNTLGGGYTRFLDDDKQNFWGGLSNIEVAPPSIDTGPFALNANQPIGLGNTFGMQRQLAGGDTGGFWGSLTGDKMKGAGSILGGVGNLASAWAAIKGLGLVKDQMAQQQEQWDKNFQNQEAAARLQLLNQNTWKTAQGRTDTPSWEQLKTQRVA